MMNSKRIKALLLLGVMVLSLLISGCEPEQGVEPSETVNEEYPYTLEQLLSMRGCDISELRYIDYFMSWFSSKLYRYEEEPDLKAQIDEIDQRYALISESEFKELRDENISHMYAVFGDESVLFYFTQDHHAVMVCDASYYISEDEAWCFKISGNDIPQ